MKVNDSIAVFCFAYLFFPYSSHAAALQVSPVSLDLTVPERAASVNLRNDSSEPTNVQARVFIWTQVNGKDQLTPAVDVIATPPAVKVQPGKTYTIRVTHLDGSAKRPEESYRLLIDELPDINVRRRNVTVNMVTRYSLPVFFSERSAASNLQWKVRQHGKNVQITATNTGTRHAKIANLMAVTGNKQVSFGSGLNGYVLAGSTVEWEAMAGKVKQGDQLTITAKGDDYAVKATAVVSGG